LWKHSAAQGWTGFVQPGLGSFSSSWLSISKFWFSVTATGTLQR
jgi:hypothetical protein